MQYHVKLLGGLTKLEVQGISLPMTTNAFNGLFSALPKLQVQQACSESLGRSGLPISSVNAAVFGVVKHTRHGSHVMLSSMPGMQVGHEFGHGRTQTNWCTNSAVWLLTADEFCDI